jgi:Uncharacterized membrane protein, required for colicin V production
MNWLDIALLCLAGIGLIKGLFDGMIKQVVSLIALFAAIFFCVKAAKRVHKYILELGWFSEDVTVIVSYIVGFILILGIVLLAGEIVHRVIGVTPLSILNHLVGGAVGFVLMLFFISIFLNILDVVDTSSKWISQEAKTKSRFYYPTKEILPTIYQYDLFKFSE